MTDDLFNNQQSDQLQFDENKDYLAELVGDDKKFKDLNALAKGKAFSDAFIEHQNRQLDLLKQDYARLRDDYASRAKLEEYIDQLKTLQGPASSDNLPQANEDKAPTFDPAKLQDLVSETISRREAERREQENLAMVRSRLTEHFGENFQSALKKHVDELGMSQEEFNATARRNPKLLFKALELDRRSSEGFQAPPRTEQRPAFAPNTPKRTWTFYENLRMSNPDVYWEPKTQNQMHKDHQTLGDAFEDGNYKQL